MSSDKGPCTGFGRRPRSTSPITVLAAVVLDQHRVPVDVIEEAVPGEAPNRESVTDQPRDVGPLTGEPVRRYRAAPRAGRVIGGIRSSERWIGRPHSSQWGFSVTTCPHASCLMLVVSAPRVHF